MKILKKVERWQLIKTNNEPTSKHRLVYNYPNKNTKFATLKKWIVNGEGECVYGIWSICIQSLNTLTSLNAMGKKCR